MNGWMILRNYLKNLVKVQSIGNSIAVMNFRSKSTPEEALNAALLIKVVLKSLQLDARMSLGFGGKRYESEKITESNGTAFIRSGELFETLKKTG